MAISILFDCIMSRWSSCTISKALSGTPKKTHAKKIHTKNTGKHFRGALWISHTQSKYEAQTTGNRKQALRFFVLFTPVMSPGGKIAVV